MTRCLRWFALMMSLSVVVACGGSGSSGNTGGGGASGLGGSAMGGSAGAGGSVVHPDFVGPSAAHTVAGVATEIAHGTRIAGAQVTVIGGTQTAITDSKGEFLLSNLPEGLVSLGVSKDGYAPGYATAESGTAARAALVSLKKEGQLQSYDATRAATLSETTENGPYAVIFAPSTLDTTDTNLTVSVTPLDPTKEDGALPGDLIAGGTSPSPLDSVTFAEFSVLDSTGQRVNLKPESNAIVELPIPFALRAAYPLGSKIHCYAYNPTTGKWEDFVEGTVEVSTVDQMTPVLRASIRHFSWYGGAPAIQDQDCVLVQVFSKYTGKPLEGATVTASPGLSEVTNADGIALITVKKDAKIKYFASKTYTDTYIDDSGNLIARPGAKVIEIGRVETDELLAPLTAGPCSGSESTSDKSKAVRIETGPMGNGDFGYEIQAIINSGQTIVIVQRGIPDTDGTLQNPEPASGAVVTVRTASGTSLVLPEILAGMGYYGNIASGLPAQGGEQYTISVDTDGNGSVDGTASCVVPGVLSWVLPVEGGSYASADFVASWSDSVTGRAGYSPLYVVYFTGTAASTIGAVYAGSELSFRPDPVLTAGSYTGSLQSQYSTTDFSGVGVDGQLLCGASAATPTVSFTIR